MVSRDARAPFRGLDVTWGQYATPGLARYPYVYVPSETISFTVLANAGEVYDAVVVVRGGARPWQVLGSAYNSFTIPLGDQITLTFEVPANLADGDSYQIEVGDPMYFDNSQAGILWATRRFAVQEYVLQIEVDRPAYIGGDDVIMTWSANKLRDGSLAASGDGQIWVYNTNVPPDNLRPNPFRFGASSGSTTFTLPDLADPNFDGIVEGWFNSTPIPPSTAVYRFQWTCVGLAVSYAVRNLGVCPLSFTIDNLGVIVNLGAGQYPPGGIVTVNVLTVVTNNQPNPSPFDPAEPYILVSISVWDVTGTATNETQYAAAGMQTDAHGDLTYLFQLDQGIPDASMFEVRVNASHRNTLWRWGEIATFSVRVAAALTLELQFNQDEYQAGDTVTVVAIATGQGTATLTYIFEVRDMTASGACGGFGGTFLASSTQTTTSYSYTIDNNFAGRICFTVTADDGQGNQVQQSRQFTVVFGWLLVNADRLEYSAGDRITVSWELVSNRIDRNAAIYFYEVEDSGGNFVTSGSAPSSFQFNVPSTAPSASYRFMVTANEGGRAVSGSITLSELSGFFLTASFDRSSYAPGDTVRIRYTISARSSSSVLPNTFVLSYGLLNGPVRRTATSSPTGELQYVVPRGIDEGDELFLVQEQNTGATVYEVLSIRGLTVWFATLGGVPVIVILLLLWLLVMTLLLWRKGVLLGPMGPKPPAPVETPPSPSEPVYAPASSPMTVTCRSCGSPIEITTSKRPIEVMCPKCGNTEMVA